MSSGVRKEVAVRKSYKYLLPDKEELRACDEISVSRTEVARAQTRVETSLDPAA